MPQIGRMAMSVLQESEHFDDKANVEPNGAIQNTC